MKKKLSLVVAAIIVCVATLVGCTGYDARLPFYDMNIYDLSTMPEGTKAEHEYLYDQIIVDTADAESSVAGKDSLYLGHPDSVMLDNGNILTAYPVGHGRGETLFKISKDDGLTWVDHTNPLPNSFKLTDETPTIYKLDLVDGDQKLLLASGRPGWGETGQGFDVSLSTSKTDGSCDGKTWSEHNNYFSYKAVDGYVSPDGHFEAIVAFASLTQVYENGVPTDKWMGIFHDYGFNVYKTFLTFDSDDEMEWTYPTRVVDMEYRDLEQSLQFCEPEVVRSPEGNELAMIFRTNARASNSYAIFSTDEGATWGEPQPLSRELTGDRHKAEYDPVSGKLIITYRSTNWKEGQLHEQGTLFSRGWVAWVGDYDDLHAEDDGKGDFLIKLAHTYDGNQKTPETYAAIDTGYSGLTIDENGLVVLTSYGKFSPKKHDTLGGQTYIITKRFTIADICDNFKITLS